MESHQEVLPQSIDPLPYFPKLCRVLGGVTISIVLVYLEIHHSPPESDPDAKPARAGLRNPPTYLDCDQACDDLGVSRRTLHTALDALSVWWKGETQRSGAARSGRDFLRTYHSLDGGKLDAIRPYAIVGTRQWNGPRTLAIHRNDTRLEQIAIDSGIVNPSRCVTSSESGNSSHSVGSLSTVLESALNLKARKAGIEWGWSDSRRVAASERMADYWANYRKRAENDAVGGSR